MDTDLAKMEGVFTWKVIMAYYRAESQIALAIVALALTTRCVYTASTFRLHCRVTSAQESLGSLHLYLVDIRFRIAVICLNRRSF